MTTSDTIQLLAWIVPSLGGTVYAAVRLAIRAEVSALELRIAATFVTKEVCHAIRRDCERIRTAGNCPKPTDKE